MNSKQTPTVLALDAAGNACSAALWHAGELAGRRWEEMARGHAEALVPMAAAVVAPVGFGALDAVCVTVGPGAYTGLRVAIATARGLSLALGVPALGIGSFDVHERIARRDSGAAPALAVLLETKRRDVYFRLSTPGETGAGDGEVCDAAAVAARLRASVGPVVLAGDAAARLGAEHPDAAGYRVIPTIGDAAFAAEIAVERLATGDIAGGAAAPPRPLYLRAPDVTPPSADRQRLRG
jgi:tRNA threonylcarbamoyladenosine biosynthesis protein TsaB